MATSSIIINLKKEGINCINSPKEKIVGLIVNGQAIAHKLQTNKVYLLKSVTDIIFLGITVENNYTAYNEIIDFYNKATEKTKLYLYVIPVNISIKEIYSLEPNSPLRKILNASGKQIQLLGINKNPLCNDTQEKEVDKTILIHSIKHIMENKIHVCDTTNSLNNENIEVTSLVSNLEGNMYYERVTGIRTTGFYHYFEDFYDVSEVNVNFNTGTWYANQFTIDINCNSGPRLEVDGIYYGNDGTGDLTIGQINSTIYKRIPMNFVTLINRNYVVWKCDLIVLEDQLYLIGNRFRP